MIRTRYLLASVALLGAGSVFAAEPAASQRAARVGGHTEALFIQGWDRDGDGKVARAEYEAARKERFTGSDEDGNGTLSADEYADEYAVRLDRQIADERKSSIEQTHVRFRSLDKDHDKAVSRAEYDASGAHAFEQLHPDKDGRVTKQDPEASKRTPTEGATRPRQRSVINMPSTHSRAGFIEIYDEDKDGAVSREQYSASRAAAFTHTDSNSDGKFDESEYVDEFADRLDRQIERVRRGQLKQAQVRFESIDESKDGGISREEYFAMSTRQFERADTNKDGVVAADDPPPARERAASR